MTSHRRVIGGMFRASRNAGVAERGRGRGRRMGKQSGGDVARGRRTTRRFFVASGGCESDGNRRDLCAFRAVSFDRLFGGSVSENASRVFASGAAPCGLCGLRALAQESNACRHPPRKSRGRGDSETEEIGNGRSAVEPRVGVSRVAGHQAVPVMHRHQKLLASAEVQREVLETLCGAWETSVEEVGEGERERRRARARGGRGTPRLRRPGRAPSGTRAGARLCRTPPSSQPDAAPSAPPSGPGGRTRFARSLTTLTTLTTTETSRR